MGLGGYVGLSSGSNAEGTSQTTIGAGLGWITEIGSLSFEVGDYVDLSNDSSHLMLSIGWSMSALETYECIDPAMRTYGGYVPCVIDDHQWPHYARAA
jgi:hypothetical protein